MAEQIDVQGLLGSLLPDLATADKAEGLRRADLMKTRGATAAYFQPEQERNLREGIGGMFGLDMRNEAEKARDQLKALGVPETAAQHKAYADVLDKVKPGAGVTYMMAVAQEARDKQRADASTTQAGAQETNANVNQEFEGRRVSAMEGQLVIEQGQLDLAELTQEDLVDYRNMVGDQTDRELTIKEQEDITKNRIADLTAADIGERSLAAVREYAREASEAATQTRSIRNLANEFARVEVSGGALGTMKEKWKAMTGTQDEITALLTKFNQVKNNMVMEALPPGVASDKDIEMAKSGFPDETWNDEQISSYMKGMAKISALASAEAEAHSIYLSENKGDDSGFLEVWRKKANEPGFGETLAAKHGLVWRPNVDENGVPVAPMSDAEAQRLIEARKGAEAEIFERNRQKSIQDTMEFIRGVNGQGMQPNDQPTRPTLGVTG
jgi:hypothetical protein